MDELNCISGLIKELSNRTNGAEIIFEAPLKIESKNNHEIKRIFISYLDKAIGYVDITSYECIGGPRTSSIEFEGEIPNFNHGKEIKLLATEDPSPRGGTSYIKDIYSKNNTEKNPLYRHDSYDINLANHEEDGEGRTISIL